MNKPRVSGGRDEKLKKVETPDSPPSKSCTPKVDKATPSPQSIPVRRSGRTAARNANGKILTKRVLADQVPAPKTQKIIPARKARMISLEKDKGLALEEERQNLIRKLTVAKAAAEPKRVTEFARQKKVIKMYQRITGSKSGKRELDAIHNTKSKGGEGYKAGIYKPDSRQEAHDRRKLAEGLYEDFLYFQNPVNRENITVCMEHAKDEHGEFPKEPPKGGMPHAIFYEELQPYMELFVKENIGMNKTNRNRTIHPDELHLLTPDARREPVGVGQRRVRETLRPTSWEFDQTEIEKKRQRIENITNTERRRMETGIDLRTCSTLRGNCLGKLRTNAGLILSAAETSEDWRTSYDHLGKVVAGRICKTIPKLSSSSKVGRHGKKADAPQRPGTLQELLHGNVSEPITDGIEKPEPVPVYEYENTTQWGFESTYGRREFHAYRRLRPFSPVQSPPHSPTVNSEKYCNEHRSAQTGTSNDEADFDKSNEEYRQQLGDHHGITDPAWPTKTFKVPYNPFDAGSLGTRLDPKLRDGINAENCPSRNHLDQDGRILNPATPGTSMGLLREALNIGFTAPDSEESVPSRAGEYTKSYEDSDDNRDLFTQSYQEDSGDTGVLDEYFPRRRSVDSGKEYFKDPKRKYPEDGLETSQAKKAKSQVKQTR